MRFFCFSSVLANLVIASSACLAQDKIFQKAPATAIEGQIIGVEGDQVVVRMTRGELKIQLSRIERIEMDPPIPYQNALGEVPSVQIAMLEPLTSQFNKLPADWYVEALSVLGEAYLAENKTSKALKLFEQLKADYTDEAYQAVATAGLASAKLQTGDATEALQLVQPIIKNSNKSFAPTSSEGKAFGRAYLIRGQALEKLDKHQQALESYLNVVTIFYHSPAAAAEAKKRADDLRAANPDLTVQ